MAMIDARVLRTLKVTESQGEKQTKQLSASEDYLLLFDEKNPSFGDALSNTQVWANLFNASLPQLGDERTLSGTRFYCNSRDLSWFKDNERAIVMTVRYAAKDEADDEQPQPPEGTDADTWKRITVQTQQVTEPARGWVTFDLAVTNNPASEDTARNSAGDPVDGLEEETSLIRLTYTNPQVTDPNFEKLIEYTNTCNSEIFLGGGAYLVRCTGWSGEWDEKNNIWSISVEFVYKPTGWDIQFYDVGFNEIKTAPDGTEKRYAILDERSNPVSKPVPLDGSGKAAAITAPTTGEFQPVPLSFRYLYPYWARDLNKIWNDCRI